MRLDRLYTHGFRNLLPAEILCGPRFNIFCGANGQGKTNILEAIYLLGTLKSFRHARNRDLIQYTADRAMLKGQIEHGAGISNVAVELDMRLKHPRIDGKPVERVGDFFGHLNVVLFAPDDLQMLKGQPELRRRYLDRAVFSVDLGYLRCFHDYVRILKNRNALLKSGDSSSLDIWNDQLVDAGVALTKRRASFVRHLAPLVQQYYRNLSGNDEQVRMQYLSPMVTEQGEISEQAGQMFHVELSRLTRDELRRGTTLAGPHRDDLQFQLNGRDVRHHASQGQLRSLILAMKMAEIAIAEERFGVPPILLLDDLAAELDRDRTGNMLVFLQERALQVFITTTDATALPGAATAEAAIYRVAGGVISH